MPDTWQMPGAGCSLEAGDTVKLQLGRTRLGRSLEMAAAGAPGPHGAGFFWAMTHGEALGVCHEHVHGSILRAVFPCISTPFPVFLYVI